MQTDKQIPGRPGARLWLAVLVFGLAGQIAWVVENMYFNVFLYNTVSTDPALIATMVAASAVVATLTTLLMGALSDRLGTRKVFLTAGYILWGLSTLSFSWISVDNVQGLFPTARDVVLLTAGIVILMDCVMTFFGSAANDAAFNAYVTDVTEPKTRGRVEGVLAALPLFAMLLVFGALDPLTQSGRWQLFFILIGVVTALTGLAGIFLIPRETRRPSSEPWSQNLLYGFKPSTILGAKDLYLALLLLGIISCAAQVYMPYLIIYIQNTLGYKDYTLILATVLLGAAAVSIAAGRLIDRLGKLALYPAALLMGIAGLVAMYLARGQAAVIAAGLLMMAGSLVLTAIAAGLVKDAIPAGMAGRFQGIRMIFMVLLPMVIGPFIGSALIKQSGDVYEELGVVKQLPTAAIFLGGAAVLLVSFLPWLWLRRRAGKVMHDTEA